MLTKTLRASGARLDTFRATSAELAELEVRSQLAGKWRMATMQVVFAVIPALIYLAGGFRGSPEASPSARWWHSRPSRPRSSGRCSGC